MIFIHKLLYLTFVDTLTIAFWSLIRNGSPRYVRKCLTYEMCVARLFRVFNIAWHFYICTLTVIAARVTKHFRHVVALLLDFIVCTDKIPKYQHITQHFNCNSLKLTNFAISNLGRDCTKLVSLIE